MISPVGWRWFGRRWRRRLYRSEGEHIAQRILQRPLQALQVRSNSSLERLGNQLDVRIHLHANGTGGNRQQLLSGHHLE